MRLPLRLFRDTPFPALSLTGKGSGLSEIPVLVRHDVGCSAANRAPGGGHSDAAKRISDTWNMHRAACGELSVGQWFAARLADGTTDGVLYASRQAAIAHQHHNERWFAFYRITPTYLSACAAASVLRWHREAYEAGLRLPDPDARAGGMQIIPRLRAEDHERQIRALRSAPLLGFGYQN